MGEAEKLAAMTTDARIVAAIKSTDYKYFGDYEMSDGQRDAVDVLVVVARELMKLRTDHLAALRRAKAEVWREVAQKYALWIGDDSNYAADPQLDEYKRFEDYCDARAAQIEEGDK